MGIVYEATERDCCVSVFSRAVWGHAPPGKIFFSGALLEQSKAYSSAVEPDSPHFLQQTSTK